MIIDTIIDLWYNDEIINKEVIRNSYLYCTISNNLDTKDDELFQVYGAADEEDFDKDIEDDSEEQNYETSSEESDI